MVTVLTGGKAEGENRWYSPPAHDAKNLAKYYDIANTASSPGSNQVNT